MEKLFYSPKDFVCRSDAQAIQCAVDAAVATDIRVVVIPEKDDGTAWHLDRTVTLPGYVTVILDGCKLRTDRTAFINSNAEDMATKSLGGEQHQIYIVGRNGAEIVTDYPEPQIVLSNVRGYRIAGITFRGGAGVKLNFARHGKLLQLKFRGCARGLSLSEGCNNNIIEDICAETAGEAVCFQGAEGVMFARGQEIAETIVSRVSAKTQDASAITVCAGPCETYNLMIRDVTAVCGSAPAIRLGTEADTMPIVDITVRGVKTQGTAVETAGICDGLYIANAAGQNRFLAENRRVFVDDTQAGDIQLPQFSQSKTSGAYITPNDPAFFGDTDAETLQNAVNAAAKLDAMLLIPRWNDRTQTTLWDINKAVVLPSNITVTLLGCHLRQADFCYDNLFYAENAENITITGVGDAVVDGGIHNQLKARNADTYGLDIRANATMRFVNVHGLVLENFQYKRARWYSLCCSFCHGGRISAIDFENHPLLPDQGGIQLQSGCSDLLIENLSGVVGEDLVHIRALAADGTCGQLPADIHHIHVRNMNVNVSRRVVVRMVCHDGRKLHHVVAETILDPSLPEDKKVTWAAVAVGSVQLSTERLCTAQELSDILIRDVYSRADRIVELGGNSSRITIVNIHGFGSCDMTLQTRAWADPEALYARGLFFRCIQGSRYMRGTATSTITDKRKYIGRVLNLSGYKATDTLIEHVFAEKVGIAYTLTGSGALTVKNSQIGQIGKSLGICGSDSTLTIDGQTLPQTTTKAL